MRESCLLLQAEFEAGFERGGQTREHAQLAKTLGVAKLIVTVRNLTLLSPYQVLWHLPGGGTRQATFGMS